MKKVLLIVGSMRKESFNRQSAVMVRELLQDKAEAAFLEYADIPFMNQDIEFPIPEAIQRVRDEVTQADGIWFFTPEYNSSYTGVLKNLLDWLSRPTSPGAPRSETAIYGKKAVITGVAGRSAAAGSRGKLAELLKFMSVDVMDDGNVGISLDGTAFSTGVMTLSKPDLEALEKEAEQFVQFLNN